VPRGRRRTVLLPSRRVHTPPRVRGEKTCIVQWNVRVRAAVPRLHVSAIEWVSQNPDGRGRGREPTTKRLRIRHGPCGPSSGVNEVGRRRGGGRPLVVAGHSMLKLLVGHSNYSQPSCVSSAPEIVNLRRELHRSRHCQRYPGRSLGRLVCLVYLHQRPLTQHNLNSQHNLSLRSVWCIRHEDCPVFRPLSSTGISGRTDMCSNVKGMPCVPVILYWERKESRDRSDGCFFLLASGGEK